MSLGTNIEFQDKNMRKFLTELAVKSPKELTLVVKRTTAVTLRAVKEKFLPKRTGALRQSYMSKKVDDLTADIFADSKLKYANAIEFGDDPRIVKAKPGKFLTIPLRPEVLTSTKAQIKKSALDKLFARLKNRKSGETRGDIMQSVGVALAKEANLPRRKPQRNIQLKAKPFAEKRLAREVKLAYKKLGFS